MSSIPPYKNASLPLPERVADLLARMTLEEKAAQLDQLPESWGDGRAYLKNGLFDAETFDRNLGKNGVGSVHQREDKVKAPKDYAISTNAAQKFLVENTRLGIPALIIAETLHGHVAHGCAIFPQAIGLASSWNPALVEQVGSVIGKETRACGSTSGLSPVLDCARDPRWGRIEETYGEDPYLVSRLGVAMVFGMQGRGETIGKDHIIATPKHFAGHGGPLGGRDSNPVGYGSRHLREVFLPPFEAVVREAKAQSAMAAYSDWRGIPCNASRELLTEILREEWGFEGYVIEDMGAIILLTIAHSVVEPTTNGATMAIQAGVDQSFGGRMSEAVLDSVRAGRLAESVLDRAVARVLRAKFLLGLFENPCVDPERTERVCDCDEHRALAREAARQSVILLKNEGDVLPLRKDIATLAVIGPNANTVETGDYSGTNDRMVTPLDGIRNAVGKNAKVLYAEGCKIMGIPTGRWVPVGGKFLTPKGTARGFAPQPGATGIMGEFFPNPDLAGTPLAERVDGMIQFEWGCLPPDSTPGMPASGYSIRWSGTLTPEVSGAYRLGVTHSDGARLRVNRKTLVDHWEAGPAATHAADIELTADTRYEVEVEYRCVGNHGECRLVWRGADLREDEAGIAEAVEVARAADVAILFIGGALPECGEVRDSANLDLPGRQNDLIKAVHATRTPVVLVHIGGRPHTMEWALDHCPAVVNLWYAGEEGGNAIADVLFGDFNPCAKLPVTWPAFVGQLPMTYDESQTGRCKHWGYVYTTNDPSFVFGHGLSYTRFAYSNLRVPEKAAMGSDVEVSVDVTNTGARAGVEVAQLYVRDLIASVKRPLKQLKGFERVSLKPGETKTVRFTLTPSHLQFWNASMSERIVEPGEFLVMVGGSSQTVLESKFRLE